MVDAPDRERVSAPRAPRRTGHPAGHALEGDLAHGGYEALEAEAIRLTETYEQLQGSTKPNIRNRYSHLNGEAYAVNDSIRVNGCKLAAVQIPSFYNHHKYPGSPE
jgi:hypothetical protein